MRNSIQHQLFTLPMILALMLVATGCEDTQKASVKGIVTLDGKPLERGIVLFDVGNNSKGRSASGSIRKDGTYSVRIGQSGELYVGEYGVTVKSHSPSIPHPQGGPPTPGESLIPLHYSEIESSGLRYNVRSGENTIDIPLATDQADEEIEGATTESEAATDDASTTKVDEQGSAEKPAEGSEEESSEEPTVGAQSGTEETAAP